MNLFGLDTAQIKGLIENAGKTINNFELRTKGLGSATTQAKKAAKSLEKTSENANSFIDMGKHTILGGLIGGAMSAMTGIGGLMPIGALIGLGIGYDFNKFTNGELPIQNNSKPKEANLLDLVKQYAKFRYNFFMGQPKKSEIETSTETPKTDEQQSQETGNTAQADTLKTLNDNVQKAQIEAKKLFSDSKLPTNLLILPTQFLNTPNISNDNTINDTVFNTALENHDDWKSLTQNFTDEKKNILKEYITAELLRLHAEKQNKEEND